MKFSDPVEYTHGREYQDNHWTLHGDKEIMASEIIESVFLPPLPSSYRKELGKNAYIDNIGMQRLEWVVCARSSSGAEGISIANRLMREGTVESTLAYLKSALLGREVEQLLEIS